jgi:hypothetical protein
MDGRLVTKKRMTDIKWFDNNSVFIAGPEDLHLAKDVFRNRSRRSLVVHEKSCALEDE